MELLGAGGGGGLKTGGSEEDLVQNVEWKLLEDNIWVGQILTYVSFAFMAVGQGLVLVARLKRFVLSKYKSDLCLRLRSIGCEQVGRLSNRILSAGPTAELF